MARISPLAESSAVPVPMPPGETSSGPRERVLSEARLNTVMLLAVGSVVIEKTAPARRWRLAPERHPRRRVRPPTWPSSRGVPRNRCVMSDCPSCGARQAGRPGGGRVVVGVVTNYRYSIDGNRLVWAPGCKGLAAHDEPGTCRPRGQVDQVGHLGDRGAFACFAILVEGVSPTVGVVDNPRDPSMDLAGGAGHDREPDVAVPAAGGETGRAARRVRSHPHRPGHQVSAVGPPVTDTDPLGEPADKRRRGP